MIDPPHKIQNTKQSKITHLHYTRRTVHKGIDYLRVHKSNILKLDSIPLLVIDPIVVNLYILIVYSFPIFLNHIYIRLCNAILFTC